MIAGRKKNAEFYITFGGLPRFFFGASVAEVLASPVAVAPFLFLLPLGRPRPRFGGAPLLSAGEILIASDCYLNRVTGSKGDLK